MIIARTTEALKSEKMK